MENTDYPPQPEPVVLPISVEQLINQLSTARKQPPLGYQTRRKLALIGEEKALEVLRIVADGPINGTFDEFMIHLSHYSRLIMHRRGEPVLSSSTPISVNVEESSSVGSSSTC
ncbi:uncharacterized protein LOC126669627 [Mercurialis annua]|uniref:uncharacterized protein LOC126669627 n=1 Tax=Mercurialis annua TaxID=3986 RepID=UPI00215EE928|nr:uncharacterized protein LOC126669627 [Mercurialis annua]